MLHIDVLQCTATSLSKPVHHTKNVNIISAIALIDRFLHSDIKSNMSFLGTFLCIAFLWAGGLISVIHAVKGI